MTSENFNKYYPILLELEGGFVNNPDDPGGATKYGVSLRTLRAMGMIDFNGDGINDFDIDGDGDVDADDIKLLTPETAKPFYYEVFWKPNRCDDILDLTLASKVCDMSVNLGSKQAIKLIQRALSAIGIPLVADGIIGDNTINGINDFSILKTPFYECTIGNTHKLLSIRLHQISFYERLALRKAKLTQFLSGWRNRANHI